jgi:hypothetical protein
MAAFNRPSISYDDQVIPTLSKGPGGKRGMAEDGSGGGEVGQD